MNSGGGGGGLTSPEVCFIVFVVYFFSVFKVYLIVPKREIFMTELFTLRAIP
jgi:hypothetical protein